MYRLGISGAKYLKPLNFFFNQDLERFYSDRLIRIHQSDKILVGEGFESNASFSHYTIRHPKGIFPVQDKADSVSDSTVIHP